MDKVIVLPKLGDEMEEAEISQWLVKEGDKVEKEAPLVEVLVEKASVELNAEFSCTIKKILKVEGSIVKVGEDIVVVEI